MATREGPDQPADLYQVLGVDARAARADIVRAYRQLARGSHPDARPGDPSAEARFRLVTLAYQVLADSGRRAAYDRAHPEAGTVQPAAQPAAGGAPAGRAIRVRQVTGSDPAAAGGDPAAAGGRPGWPPLWAGPVLVEPPGGSHPGYPEPPRPGSGSGRLLPEVWDWWG